ncbi:NhaP-type Na+/H+ or K+/H+ antiporter [Streptosporangium becharense]|uniref:NhaP-type Na+/H+ or K+/H+ antiporter n=1 Tax=Streptosporangium becharense TaxID=1816182 RepID=A0A7W9MEQ9_9ACTN|nr:cation:proton antiporter [Streptosporangium becharense]MBB2915001.1 NhaP-type Na+/H+ or K+/H+ antiporter [Streptosporangium becharense]MBB5818050.1 NhaP-type Na+/H+ or K+/H+ antiporter [Streptosporangium becharense]
MGNPDLIFVVAGCAALLAAVLPRLLNRRPFSLPLACLLGGLLIYFLPLDLPTPDPVAHRGLVEHVTEICVLISLMGAGLAINRPFGRRDWSSTWRLLGLTLPLTVAAVAAVAYGLLGWPLAAALLLGAVLAPTDPVLASDVQVGEPVDSEEDDDEVRFTLTSEAGLNDGLAFPLVYGAIALALSGGAGWIGEWALVDLLYRCAAGVVCGLLMGRLLGRMFFHARPANLRLAEHRDGFVALAATFLAYGVTELVHGYGFIAVFVTACSIRAAERTHGYNNVLHGFIEQIERLFTAWLIVLLGGFIALGGLSALTWRGVAAAFLLLLVIRPLTAWLAALGGPAGPRERIATAFFGIRGIGSLFYLAYALGQADFGVPAEELWAVVAFTVLASLVVHGISASPVMNRLDRLRVRVGRERDEEPAAQHL